MKRITKQVGDYTTNIWKNEYKHNTLEFTIILGTYGKGISKLYGIWTYSGEIDVRISFLDDEYFGYELTELAEIYERVLFSDLETAMKELLGTEDIY